MIIQKRKSKKESNIEKYQSETKAITRFLLIETYKKHVNKLKKKRALEGHLNRDEKRSLLWKEKRLNFLIKN